MGVSPPDGPANRGMRCVVHVSPGDGTRQRLSVAGGRK